MAQKKGYKEVKKILGKKWKQKMEKRKKKIIVKSRVILKNILHIYDCYPQLKKKANKIIFKDVKEVFSEIKI